MSYPLEGYIKDNNLNWIRLILSSFVIVGHSYAIAPVVGAQDIIGSWLGFTYSGSLSVKIFFFVSGLLVCNSLLNNDSPVRYVVSRFFRIVPALFVLLLLTVFIVGPLVTASTLTEYFSDKEVFTYFFNNINLFSEAYYYLPGVFENNPHAKALNGSLWTLSKEVEMYSFLLALSMLGFLNKKILASVVLGCVVVLPIVDPTLLFSMYTAQPEVFYLPSCFALGCLAALWKGKLEINLVMLLGLILITYLLKDTTAYHMIFYIATFYFFMFISDRRHFSFPTLNVDISYGVYIYGFLIQQLVVFYFPGTGYLFNTVVSLAVCYPVAYLSCKFVEEPSIKLGRHSIAYLKELGWVKNTVVHTKP